MKLRICLLTLLFFAATSSFAQINLWGVRFAGQGNALLSDDKFNTDGFNKGGSFSLGVTYSRLKDGSSNVWRAIGTGIIYRKMNMQGKTSATNFQLKWIEIPCDLNLTGAIGSWLPIGLNAGAYMAIPLQYKGSIYRYQQPNYEYGKENYEKPFVIFGARLGASFTVRVSHIYTTFFANYNLSLIPIGKSAPDGVEREFDAPLPAFLEYGVYINFGKITKADH